MRTPARSFWIRRVVLPSAAAFIILAGAVSALVFREARQESERSAEYIAQTAKMLLREPMLLGDHMEMSKRISSLGKLFSYRIVVAGEDGEVLAAYPALTQGVERHHSVRESFAASSGGPQAVLMMEPESRLTDRVGGLIWAAVALAAAMALFGVFAFRATRVFVMDLTLLTQSHADSRLENARFSLKETEDAWQRLTDQTRSLISYERKRGLLELARQVAHDIRSPLAAMEVLLRDIHGMPEDQRALLASVAGRLRSLANNLVRDGRDDADAQGVPGDGLAAAMLAASVERLVGEKRLRFRDRPDLRIGMRCGADGYGAFAAVVPREFERILSNILDNSAEAIGKPGGSIRVTVAVHGEEAVVSVEDDGGGIPGDVLARLGQEGATYGKSHGTGLGLYLAKTSLERWGGRLEIGSEPGLGTVVRMILPMAAPPPWFLPDLRLEQSAVVVVLDDDASIHEAWRARLFPPAGGVGAAPLVAFENPGDLRRWLGQRGPEPAVFLLDYELRGAAETGIDLAEGMGIARSSVVVTSRHDDPKVVAAVQRIGSKLLPKQLLAFVPIVRAEGCSAVLIDDDSLTRLAWRIAAARQGRQLLSFEDSASFFESADAIRRETPIYVDAHLGDESGVDASRRVHALGFETVFIATGDDPGPYTGLAHLRGVVGKEPPWPGTPDQATG